MLCMYISGENPYQREEEEDHIQNDLAEMVSIDDSNNEGREWTANMLR